MLEKIKKRLLLSIGLAGLIYLAFTIYADFENVVSAFSKFNWLLLPVLIGLILGNYFFRFLKWHHYLGVLKVNIQWIDSFSIFMSGLIMSVTPGKMGEVLKSYLVKKITAEPISKTAPIVLVERITDFISLVIIAIIGAYIFDYGRTIMVITGAFFVIVILIISNKRASLAILRPLQKIRFLRKYAVHIETMYESSNQLLKPAPLFSMTALSLVSWGLECFAYYLILVNFQIDVSFSWASFVYAFSTIVGAVTMLPGGLGVTEGSLTLLVNNAGYPLNNALASTFLIRIITLWFAVLVGVISVALYQKRFGKIVIDTL